jgi:hypothetical protein
MKKKTGQAVFEFVIASLILFSVIFYTMNYVSSDFNVRHDSFISDRLEINVIRVSDMLMSTNGIVDTWPYLNAGKMDTLNVSCYNDYTGTLDDFGLKEEIPYTRYTNMRINVSDGLTTYIGCGFEPPERKESAEITRYGLLPGNNVGEVRISLW